MRSFWRQFHYRLQQRKWRVSDLPSPSKVFVLWRIIIEEGMPQGTISRTTILVHFSKSLRLTWRSGTRRWNLRVPDLQMSCRDVITCPDTRIVTPAIAANVTCPIVGIEPTLIVSFRFRHGCRSITACWSSYHNSPTLPGTENPADDDDRHMQAVEPASGGSYVVRTSTLTLLHLQWSHGVSNDP